MLYVLVYVDDLVTSCNNAELISSFEAYLSCTVSYERLGSFEIFSRDQSLSEQ